MVSPFRADVIAPAEQRAGKQPFPFQWEVTSFGVLSILSLIVVFFGQPRFLVNDDWVIRSFADGSYTGEPEADLVFVGRISGFVLNLLYRLGGNLPYYETALLITNFLAFFLLARIVRWSQVGKLAWLLCVSTVFAWLIQVPSFTTTAIVTAGIGSGVLVLRSASPTRRCSSFIFPSLIFLIGVSWRFDAVIPAAMTALFLLGALFLIQSTRWKQVVASVVISAAMIGGLSATVVTTNSICWESDINACAQWKEWREFNELRGSFHFTPWGTYLQSEAENGRLGVWSASETRQFLDWMYFDVEVHGHRALLAVDREIPDSLLPKYGLAESSFSTTLRSIAWTLTDALMTWSKVIFPWMAILMAILLAGFWGLQLSKGRTAGALVMASTGPIGALVLASSVRLPDRVLIPIVGLWMVGFLLLFSAARATLSDQLKGYSSQSSDTFSPWIVSSVAGVAIVLSVQDRGVQLAALAIVMFSLLLLVRQQRLGRSQEVATSSKSAFIVAAATVVVAAVVLPLGLVAQGLRWDVAPRPQNTIFSEKVSVRWATQTFFAPGRTTNYYRPRAYGVGAEDLGNVIFGGWPTFSPLWQDRLQLLEMDTPSFQQFVTGELFLLADKTDWSIFAKLDEMLPYEDLWNDCGSYSNEPALRVWSLDSANCK